MNKLLEFEGVLLHHVKSNALSLECDILLLVLSFAGFLWLSPVMDELGQGSHVKSTLL